MFGWELPPYNSGGLGTACLGLTESLATLGVDMDFVLPETFGSNSDYEHMRVLSAASYPLSASARKFLQLTREQERHISHSLPYGDTIVSSVSDPNYHARVDHRDHTIPAAPHTQAAWYGHQATSIAKERAFDLVHCHEWMTYYCGIAAKKVAADRGEDVPFVAHVHATEIDRGGTMGNSDIIAIEKTGLQSADRIVAVSHYTKEIIRKNYDVPGSKISVVHNGMPSNGQGKTHDLHALKKHHKLVLFMGRITMQKGPEYFIKLAKAVTDRDPSVLFIMVGSGDLERTCIEQAAAAGLTGKILFNTFLRGEDVNKAYQMADLFVMPSVSEPFGLVALEALHNGTPAIVSKQSGVAEVSENLIKVDFWDTEKMQEEILRLLYSPKESKRLISEGRKDVTRLSWNRSAGVLHDIYQDLTSGLVLPNKPITS